MSNCTVNEIKPNTIRKQIHATEINPRFTSYGSIFKNTRRQVLSLVVLTFLFFTVQAQTNVVNVTNSNGGGGAGVTGTWTVPSGGPYKIRITAKGASGGGTYNSSGGLGAVIVGEFTVTSGQGLEYNAGASGGGGGDYAGGGGGGTGVRIKDGSVLIIAGGGGGGGGDFSGYSGGP